MTSIFLALLISTMVAVAADSRALIIFVRNPELGKVKTRLAAGLGQELALSIYRKLLAHTHEIALETDADKLIFFAGDGLPEPIWKQKRFVIQPQPEGDLGQKMLHAFASAFQKGYGKGCIVGSDCIQLTSEHIELAFNALDDFELVLGPASDGGYYLLACRSLHASLFLEKQWSHDKVLRDALDEASKLGLRVKLLEILNDVDEPEDVPVEWLEQSI